MDANSVGYPCNFLITLAGTPPASEYSGISLVTTAPEAIVDPFPIVTPGRIIALAPIQQSSPILIGNAKEPPALFLKSGLTSWVSVQRQAPGPIRTPSPIITLPLS